MTKIGSLDELKKMRDSLRTQVSLREKGENIEDLTQIRVAMGDCGIKAGAKEIMLYITDKCKEMGLEDVIVLQTACLGECENEPSVELVKVGEEAVIYRNVDKAKADEIIASIAQTA